MTFKLPGKLQELTFKAQSSICPDKQIINFLILALTAMMEGEKSIIVIYMKG
jgi:hypothetical protein